MKLEKLISKMMSLNTKARLWHWMTDIAQHHTTYEQFLTQNEVLTDSLVESALGNELPIALTEVAVETKCKTYSIENATFEIKEYRALILEMKKNLEGSDKMGADELVTILDDVIELCSKSLYLLKLK